MSFSDDDDTAEEGSGLEEDKKLEELWARKMRRRSSLLKTFAGDHLELAKSGLNPKTAALIAKSGACGAAVCALQFYGGVRVGCMCGKLKWF